MNHRVFMACIGEQMYNVLQLTMLILIQIISQFVCSSVTSDDRYVFFTAMRTPPPLLFSLSFLHTV